MKTEKEIRERAIANLKASIEDCCGANISALVALCEMEWVLGETFYDVGIWQVGMAYDRYRGLWEEKYGKKLTP